MNRADGTGRRPYLRIERLTKTFGEFVALEEVSLEVYEGEFVCFLGPSGCGKTTLLRAIAGLDIQTRGRVEQAGVDVSALPPSERDFGIVFQSYALFPNLSVNRNIAYGLENRKAPRVEIDQRVEELLKLVGLPDQGDKYPSQLSGGQQQRIALARAIATSPGLLLLDEPLSALDAKVRVHLRHEIKALQRRLGVTTVMVTHDQEEALTMADRIVVMNQGYIEQVGTPLEIYRDPATAFVADFIGTMNFVAGTIATSDTVHLGDARLRYGGGDLNPGDEVTVAVRPEDIVVLENIGTETNAFVTRVVDMEFLGSFYRAELSEGALDGMRLQADFSINRVRGSGIEVGQELAVKIPAERIRLYPKSAARG